MGVITEQQARHYFGVAADMASVVAACRCAGDVYFQTDTKAAYVWDGAAWVGPVPADWITAAMLKTDAVETLKIKDLNVTKGKAELGFGRYVPRDVAAVDFLVGDFTVDGAWHADGLDLSSIVTAGAIAVHLELALADGTAGLKGEIRGNATTKVQNTLNNRTQVSGLTTPYMQGIVNIDSNRLLDYFFDTGMDTIVLKVLGWFI